MWFRYTPAPGASPTTYQTFVSVIKTYEPQGAVMYNVTGDIEIEPVTA